VEVREHEPAVAADERDAPRHPHGGVGLAAGLEAAELLANLGERVVAVEPVGRAAAGGQALLLGEPLRALRGDEVLPAGLGRGFRSGGFTARVHAGILPFEPRVRQGRGLVARPSAGPPIAAGS
jgi:hypothetical protein